MCDRNSTGSKDTINIVFKNKLMNFFPFLFPILPLLIYSYFISYPFLTLLLFTHQYQPKYQTFVYISFP